MGRSPGKAIFIHDDIISYLQLDGPNILEFREKKPDHIDTKSRES